MHVLIWFRKTFEVGVAECIECGLVTNVDFKRRPELRVVEAGKCSSSICWLELRLSIPPDRTALSTLHLIQILSLASCYSANSLVTGLVRRARRKPDKVLILVLSRSALSVATKQKKMQFDCYHL